MMYQQQEDQKEYGAAPWKSKNEYIPKNATPSLAPIARIHKIHFGTMSSEDIMGVSDVEVTKYPLNAKGFQARNSVVAPELGPLDRNGTCLQCRLSPCKCDSSFGHAPLGSCVYHTLELTKISKTIRSICWHCSELLLDPDSDKFKQIYSPDNPSEDWRSDLLTICSRISKCWACEGPQYNFTWKDKEFKLIGTKKPQKKRELKALAAAESSSSSSSSASEATTTTTTTTTTQSTNAEHDTSDIFIPSPQMVRDRFERISDRNARLLGFNPPLSHPKHMILSVLPIPPNDLTPSIKYNTASKSGGTDPLRRVLQFIAKINDELWEAIEKVMTKEYGFNVANINNNNNNNNTSNILSVEPETTVAVITNNVNNEKRKVKAAKTASTLTAVFRARNALKKADILKEQNQVSLKFNDQGEVSIERTSHSRNASVAMKQDVMSFEDPANLLRFINFDPALHPDTAEIVDDLQYNIALYFKDDIKEKPPRRHRIRSQAKINTSQRTRLKGKKGSVRNTMRAKRVDFSFRGVITPDPLLEIDEVGLPAYIMRTMTTPEIVNPMNWAKLQRAVLNGPCSENSISGATTVMMDDNETCDLRFKDRYNTILQPGWEVERHIEDGDAVIFNRQPSLHKPSLMKYRARRVTGSSLRLNLSPTPAHNADFDGDAMVGHVPQSHPSRIESNCLMSVNFNILNPQSNKPLIPLVQDALLACYYMTGHDMVFNEEDYLRYRSHLRYLDPTTPLVIPSIVHRSYVGPSTWISYRTGKQLFSESLPVDLHYYQHPPQSFEHPIIPIPLHSNHAIHKNNHPSSTCSFCQEPVQHNKDWKDEWKMVQHVAKVLGWTSSSLSLKSNNNNCQSLLLCSEHSAIYSILKWHQDKENIVIDSQLYKGSANVKMVGKASNSLLHHMALEYDAEEVGKWLSEIQKICPPVLNDIGASVGISDTVVENDEEVQKLMTDVLNAIRSHPILNKRTTTEQSSSSSSSSSSSIMRSDGTSDIDKKENTMDLVSIKREQIKCMVLNEATSFVGKKAEESMGPNNRFYQISQGAGSKGDVFNQTQIAVALGQQIVDGGRLNTKKRITAHFPNDPSHYYYNHYDDDDNENILPTIKESEQEDDIDNNNNNNNNNNNSACVNTYEQDEYMVAGFIRSSFAKGLTPSEFYYHAMGGREGVVSTSVKTRETGYAQRRLNTAMENNKVENDLSVRNGQGEILQLLYGTDGFDSTFLAPLAFTFLTFSNEKLHEQYDASYLIDKYLWLLECCVPHPDFRLSSKQQLIELVKAEMDILQQYRNNIVKQRLHFMSEVLTTDIYVPCHIPRRLLAAARAQRKKEGDPNYKHQAIPASVLLRINRAFMERLYSYYPAHYNRLWDFEALFHSTLCIKNVIGMYSLSLDIYETMLFQIEQRFVRSLISPGEMVGSLAAQMLGQLFTQGALNQFHHAGAGSTENGGTISSLQACIDLTQNPSNPSMFIHLKALAELEYFLPSYAKYMCQQRANSLWCRQQQQQQQQQHSQSFQDIYEREVADYVGQSLVYRNLQYVTDALETCITDQSSLLSVPPSYEDQAWMDLHMKLVSDQEKQSLTELVPCAIRLVINAEKCQRLGLTLIDIQQYIQNFLSEDIGTGTDQQQQQQQDEEEEDETIHTTTSSSSTSSSHEQRLVPDGSVNPDQCVFLSSPLLPATSIQKAKGQHGSGCWVVRMYVHPESKYYRQFSSNKELKDDPHKIQKCIRLLAEHIVHNARIHGITQIKEAVVVQQKKYDLDEIRGKVNSHNTYVVITSGSNVLETLASPYVDSTLTMTNHLLEANDVWGNEAGAVALRTNINKVLLSHGTYVNGRFLNELVRTMVRRGKFMAIRRHEMNRVKDASVLQQASFEETVEVLIDAALSGKTDPLTGVTENTLVGNLAPMGTGATNIELPPQVPSEEVSEQHVEYKKHMVLPEITAMDLRVLLHNSGEHRVYGQTLPTTTTTSDILPCMYVGNSLLYQAYDESKALHVQERLLRKQKQEKDREFVDMIKKKMILANRTFRREKAVKECLNEKEMMTKRPTRQKKKEQQEQEQEQEKEKEIQRTNEVIIINNDTKQSRIHNKRKRKEKKEDEEDTNVPSSSNNKKQKTTMKRTNKRTISKITNGTMDTTRPMKRLKATWFLPPVFHHHIAPIMTLGTLVPDSILWLRRN